ncbi:cell division protein FtsZ [Riemerella columbina]|uniref:cell division protein FtsZ n=1 Tax=Riemerella columbina TaxID=103810 RepID=UPI002670B9A6|nr:cell division protein FtsZ [Riemerella columbina]WKS95381.1 cell division protein FtsZ [Riemerella columbina]
MEEKNNIGFELDLPKGKSSIIKVIGVGGGGNNALKHMHEKGIRNVDFIICNTDAQTLNENPITNKVRLGTTITEGLGAGADPEVGEKAAIENIDDIKAALGQNTKMVFITAGMGGGTGTGAAPIVAKVAKEMGILTVAIVTVPFAFEGKRRLEQAAKGLEKLRENVDSLIVINNDKLRQQFGNLSFTQAFSKADEVLTNAAKGMAEVITAPFSVNIDFRDAKSVLENSGTALMSTGVATGENRAEEAVRKALDSPLLNDNKITGAKNVLLLVLSGKTPDNVDNTKQEGKENELYEATMDEVGLISDYVQTEAGGDNSANIILGIGIDEELGNAIKVLVIATGFNKDKPINDNTPKEKVRRSLDEEPAPKQNSNEKRESPFKKTKVSSTTNTQSIDREEDGYSHSFTTSNSISTPIEGTLQTQKIEVLTEISTSDEFQEDEGDSASDLGFSSYGDDDFFSDEMSVTFNYEEQSHQYEVQDNDEEFRYDEEVAMEIREVSKEVTSATPVTEEPKEDIASTSFPTEEQNLFSIIEKPSESTKVQERKNKLKEFNSRYYQKNEGEKSFENIPAFRRKNLNIEDINSSEQHIDQFMTNHNGKIELRENRYLNKDVD